MHNGTTGDENLDDIDACRTCGVYYLRSVNYLRDIFNAPVDEVEMQQIRLELAAWKLEVRESDGRPQNICTGCIYEFKRFFKFRNNCLGTQQQFAQIERQKIIKTELPEQTLQTICGFIYIDDLSDDDDDDKTAKYEGSLVPSFDIPHMPLKEEYYDHARMPETPSIMKHTTTDYQSHHVATIKTGFVAKVKQEMELLQEKNTELNAVDYDSDVEIVKFTYADDSSLVTSKLQMAVARVKEETQTTCKVCLYVAVDQASLRQHMQRIHEVKDMVCHICGKTFQNTTPARLKFHLKWHKLNKHIKCAQCGFYCSSRDVLNEHTRAVHSKIKCNICDKLIFAKKLKGHLRKHEIDKMSTGMPENKEVESLRNSMQILSSYRLNSTNSSIKSNTTPLFVDTIQMLTSASDDFAAEHVRQPYEQLNTLTLQDSNDETIHDDVQNANWHGSAPKAAFEHAAFKFSCASCNDVFETIEQLRMHYESHKKYAQPQCHICGKSFNLTFKLNQHLKMHAKPH